MNRHALLSLLALLLCCSTSLPAQKAKTYIPWKNGKLVVSEEGRYLKHENGVPFFWLGETGRHCALRLFGYSPQALHHDCL